jgi:hypothetical protein
MSSHLLSKNLKIRMYKTITLSLILYGCESWSLTLRGKHRLSVFEIKVLRRTFGPKSADLAADWRKLHNEELHNLFPLLGIIRKVK